MADIIATRPTTFGTNEADRITGLPEEVNFIFALGGDDAVLGGGRNDIIDAGGGNDIINAAGGDDLVVGRAENDFIIAGTGNDGVFGERGNDLIDGGPGDDFLSGGVDSDLISGGDGVDRLVAGPGNDVLSGSGGLFKKSQKEKAEQLLKKLAEETGGRSFFPRDLSELGPITDQIATDLRTVYAIGYYPTNTKKDGSFRRVDVKVLDTSMKPDSKLVARTRSGYVADKQ